MAQTAQQRERVARKALIEAMVAWGGETPYPRMSWSLCQTRLRAYARAIRRTEREKARTK